MTFFALWAIIELPMRVRGRNGQPSPLLGDVGASPHLILGALAGHFGGPLFQKQGGYPMWVLYILIFLVALWKGLTK